MSQQDIIRAWKSPEYRESLSADQRAQLPANPAGVAELSDADLGLIAGGAGHGSGSGTGGGNGSGNGTGSNNGNCELC